MTRNTVNGIMSFVFVTAALGCGALLGNACIPTPAQIISAGFTAEQIACILENSDSEPEWVIKACEIAGDLQKDVGPLLLKERARLAAAKRTVVVVPMGCPAPAMSR